MIGVLAIQGDYAAHTQKLLNLGASSCLIKNIEQLHHCDGLIIPGGESSALLKAMARSQWFESLLAFSAKGKPIFGTCAGAILLAKEITNPKQVSLELIDMTIQRNAYGRQLQSKITSGDSLLHKNKCEMVFIRAPKIMHIGTGVKVLATCHGEITAVEQNNCIAITFHPEISNDLRWHQYFLAKAQQQCTSGASSDEKER